MTEITGSGDPLDDAMKLILDRLDAQDKTADQRFGMLEARLAKLESQYQGTSFAPGVSLSTTAPLPITVANTTPSQASGGPSTVVISPPASSGTSVTSNPTSCQPAQQQAIQGVQFQVPGPQTYAPQFSAFSTPPPRQGLAQTVPQSNFRPKDQEFKMMSDYTGGKDLEDWLFQYKQIGSFYGWEPSLESLRSQRT